MKIMVLSSHTPSLLWFRLDMMLEFKRYGCDVVAVGNENESTWSRQFQENGIVYRQAFIQRNGTNPFKDIKTLKSLRLIIKEEKPDKIFAYNAKTVIYGGMAAHKEKIDTYSLIAGLGSVFMGNGLKNRIVQAILKHEYKKSLRYSHAVFFQNHDDVDIFVNNKMVKQQQVVMLNGSGVNLDKFKVQPLPGEFGFLFIGRLIRDKGIFEYLEACKEIKTRYRDVRCLLVGPFDSNPTALSNDELQPYIEDGIIEYFGEQKDVRPYLAKCNVFVLPSYREGTPKTVLEAMASFKAIITSDAPGCRETVKDGKNGFLVPIKNQKKLAEKMIYLYEHQELIEKMALRGRQMVEELFDVKKINNKIVSTMNIREDKQNETL